LTTTGLSLNAERTLPAGPAVIDRVLDAAGAVVEEAVGFTTDLIRVPTVNPPGEAYRECAHVIGARLERCGFEVGYHEPVGRPEHTSIHPRLNVVGRRRGHSERPCLHLNGHFDVVPPGEGWTVDPFGGHVRDGRIYGRGACDMKAGLAAAVFAAEAVRRAGVCLRGTLDLSGTVDEESGGLAGVAWLAQHGRLTNATTDFVIIPEPLDVDRVCIGHRGVYWFDVTTHGRIGHGSMPFLGVSAIAHMGAVLEAVRTELEPALRRRVTELPVVPAAARHATINVNTVEGGQAGEEGQTPCVADRCRAVFDRRFLPEEGLDATRQEILALLRRTAERVPGLRYTLTDREVVSPVRTPSGSPLVRTLQSRIREVTGRDAALVASPGTYDHKHVTGIGGIEQCVAYGPGILDLAHQPDEYCAVDDLATAIRVLALAIVDLLGTTA
jgi:succinyl-diaminopimelate desuccinylase